MFFTQTTRSQLKGGIAMKNKIVASALAFTLLGSSFTVYADEIDTLKEQIKFSENEKKELEVQKQEVEKDIGTTEEKIAALNKILSNTEAKINATESKIDALENEIIQTKKEIKALEIELDKKKEILARNLQVMNSKGDVSYLEFLFSSDDVSNFLYRFSTLKDIAKANEELYEEVRKQSEIVKEKKVKLDEQKVEQELEMEKLSTLKEEQKKSKQRQVILLNELAEEHKHIEGEINERDAAMAAINNQIAGIIKEREAARKRLEEQNRIATQNNQPTIPSSDLIGSGFINPMNAGTYYVSSHYGWRTHPVHQTQKLHGGIDLAASVGTPIYAADSGTVLYAGAANGFGNWVVIDHNNGYLTVYGHMYSNQLNVSPGQQVSKGQHIAGVGSAGTSTGAHLHYEIHRSYLGNQVNPTNFTNF